MRKINILLMGFLLISGLYADSNTTNLNVKITNENTDEEVDPFADEEDDEMILAMILEDKEATARNDKATEELKEVTERSKEVTERKNKLMKILGGL